MRDLQSHIQLSKLILQCAEYSSMCFDMTALPSLRVPSSNVM